MHAHIATIADGFGMPLDLVESVIPADLATSRDYAGFNAYLDGTVVSTSALVVTDGVAGVYNVATPEAYRGRGFGGATTRAAIAEGLRRRCTYTTLQTSEMGYPLYAEMGCISRDEGLDAVFAAGNLDAIVAPTGSPACTTALVNGDLFLVVRGVGRLPADHAADGGLIRSPGRHHLHGQAVGRGNADQARLRIRSANRCPYDARIRPDSSTRRK